MKILVLGGDGYCGWPTSLHLSDAGHEVVILDNFVRRQIDHGLKIQSLTPISILAERIRAWRETGGREIEVETGDLLDWEFLSGVVCRHRPDAVVHFAEQSSAPYSMMDRQHTLYTQHNNVLGTLNLLYALRACANRRVAYAPRSGEEAVQSLRELPSAKSCQPIGAAS